MAEDDASSPADPIDPGDQAVMALMDQVAFEDQDVQDQLKEFFQWMSEKRKQEHWKLTDRQARMLGKPTAQLMNSLWARLRISLPGILGRWMDDTPGATAFLLACGLVVAPKIAQDFATTRNQSRKTSKSSAVIESAAPASPEIPKEGFGVVWGK